MNPGTELRRSSNFEEQVSALRFQRYDLTGFGQAYAQPAGPPEPSLVTFVRQVELTSRPVGTTSKAPGAAAVAPALPLPPPVLTSASDVDMDSDVTRAPPEEIPLTVPASSFPVITTPWVDHLDIKHPERCCPLKGEFPLGNFKCYLGPRGRCVGTFLNDDKATGGKQGHPACNKA